RSSRGTSRTSATDRRRAPDRGSPGPPRSPCWRTRRSRSPQSRFGRCAGSRGGTQRRCREYSAYNVRAMTPRIATAAFAAALVAGAALRGSVLRVAVLVVDDSWRAWSYHAATTGTAHMYGPRGHTVRFGTIDAPVVYPPLALDELGVVGRIYARLRGGRFPDDDGLTMAIKSTIAVFDAALTLLLYRTLRRLAGTREAQFGAAIYWLNPAVLYAASLGYVDALVALPAA